MINHWLRTSINFSYFHLTQWFTLNGLISGWSLFFTWVTSTPSTWTPTSLDHFKPSNAGEGTMAIARDCHCDSVKKKCWKRFMLASCVTIAVGGQLEIFNILLTNNEQIKSAEMFCGLRGLILAYGEEENASTWLESACWERHGYVLWGCGGIIEGTLEGMLMTHEHPKYCGQWRWSKRIQMILKIQTVQISQMKWNEWFHHDHSIITTSWLKSCCF